jgi:hypothetical protein
MPARRAHRFGPVFALALGQPVVGQDKDALSGGRAPSARTLSCEIVELLHEAGSRPPSTRSSCPRASRTRWRRWCVPGGHAVAGVRASDSEPSRARRPGGRRSFFPLVTPLGADDVVAGIYATRPGACPWRNRGPRCPPRRRRASAPQACSPPRGVATTFGSPESALSRLVDRRHVEASARGRPSTRALDASSRGRRAPIGSTPAASKRSGEGPRVSEPGARADSRCRWARIVGAGALTPTRRLPVDQDRTRARSRGETDPHPPLLAPPEARPKASCRAPAPQPASRRRHRKTAWGCGGRPGEAPTCASGFLTALAPGALRPRPLLAAGRGIDVVDALPARANSSRGPLAEAEPRASLVAPRAWGRVRAGGARPKLVAREPERANHRPACSSALFTASEPRRS